MYSNNHLDINANQDIVEGNAEFFSENIQTVDGKKSQTSSFQNLAPSKSVLEGVNNMEQPITYQNGEFQPIKQDKNEELKNIEVPVPLNDNNSTPNEINGYSITTYETSDDDDTNPPRPIKQETFKYIQPQSNYQNINLSAKNLTQKLVYIENPVNELNQYYKVFQAQPIEETMTVNEANQVPIIETKILPPIINQIPSTLKNPIYQYSAPVAITGLALENAGKTQHANLSPQYIYSYSLIQQPLIVSDPKSPETIFFKSSKNAKSGVPSENKNFIKRPTDEGVSNIQPIIQPALVNYSSPIDLSSSRVSIPNSTINIPMTSSIRLLISSQLPQVPETIQYPTGSVKDPLNAIVSMNKQSERVSIAPPLAIDPALQVANFGTATPKVYNNSSYNVSPYKPSPYNAYSYNWPSYNVSSCDVSPYNISFYNASPYNAFPYNVSSNDVPSYSAPSYNMTSYNVSSYNSPSSNVSSYNVPSNNKTYYNVSSYNSPPYSVSSDNMPFYHGPSIKLNGRNFPISSGVVPASFNNEMKGNMDFQGYNPKVYFARKL